MANAAMLEQYRKTLEAIAEKRKVIQKTANDIINFETADLCAELESIRLQIWVENQGSPTPFTG